MIFKDKTKLNLPSECLR